MGLERKLHIVDGNLIKRLKSGDREAFRSIFDFFERRLYYFVFSYTKSEYVSEEIVQEVFIKIWEKRESLLISKSFDSYIYTITKNLTLNYIRDASRHKMLKEELWKNLTYLHEQVEADYLFAEYKAIVDNIIQTLPPQKRTIYLLSKEEGKSNSEIAGLLDISIKTVKNHLWKTLVIIKEQLKPHLENSLKFVYLLLSVRNLFP